MSAAPAPHPRRLLHRLLHGAPRPHDREHRAADHRDPAARRVHRRPVGGRPYTLSFAALLLTGGTFADRFGRKRLFGPRHGAVRRQLAAVRPVDLDAGAQPRRALQGIGGAALAPSLALVATAFPARGTRIRAVSLYAALSSTALGFRPTIGGALVTGPGWRWVFFVNVPIAVACLAFGVARSPSRPIRTPAGSTSPAGAPASAPWPR